MPSNSRWKDLNKEYLYVFGKGTNVVQRITVRSSKRIEDSALLAFKIESLSLKRFKNAP